MLRPGMVGREGLWSYDYGHAQTEYTPPPFSLYLVVFHHEIIPGTDNGSRYYLVQKNKPNIEYVVGAERTSFSEPVPTR